MSTEIATPVDPVVVVEQIETSIAPPPVEEAPVVAAEPEVSATPVQEAPAVHKVDTTPKRRPFSELKNKYFPAKVRSFLLSLFFASFTLSLCMTPFCVLAPLFFPFSFFIFPLLWELVDDKDQEGWRELTMLFPSPSSFSLRSLVMGFLPATRVS